ncbi:hypothetical protein J1N35_026958 [Gossypium stocksii]|uniref:Uncharacterized protein n=1 Tax=Gossypium stocksii TaxID=47602 RepID=A0A9D3V9J2_9ROSI|nr:hypothetical protein J1N35_026958 [Gossypium stocksii]
MCTSMSFGGNGCTCRFWLDRWIVNIDPLFNYVDGQVSGVKDTTVANMVGANGKWQIDMLLPTLGRNIVDRTQGCSVPSGVLGGDAISWGSSLLGQFLLPHLYQDFGKGYCQVILENDNFEATRVITDGSIGIATNSSMRHIQGLLALQWQVPMQHGCGLCGQGVSQERCCPSAAQESDTRVLGDTSSGYRAQ